MIAGFMAAFMSTIATQLNWGASYLVSDFYRRFIDRGAEDKHYVNVSGMATVLLVVASALVSGFCRILVRRMANCARGRGGQRRGLFAEMVWHINAWSEIFAMATALLMTVSLELGEASQTVR